MNSTRFQTFEDLEVYKAAREFRKAMYNAARLLPKSEEFDLGRQIRRAAVSLTNNIAEGHGRFHYLDQIKFMLQARGSLQELIDDLNVCTDERYLVESKIGELKEKAWTVLRLLNSFLRFLRSQQTEKMAILHDHSASYGRDAADVEEWLATLPLQDAHVTM